MSLQDIDVQLQELRSQLDNCSVEEAQIIKKEIEKIKREAFTDMNAWDIVCLARHPRRPKAMDLVESLFTDLFEQKGDRLYGEDAALWGGLGCFLGKPVTILAQRKGKTLQENMLCNFGMMNPEGYRKALRLAKQAAKFNRPIINIVDTSGAYPGKGAEERGQAEAIAQCLKQFMTLNVPVITIVLSEGGSGGALALSVADHIMMLENSIYSILSPEGFASILWKDESRVQEAAKMMELTSKDLFSKGIVDTIVSEPLGGMQENPNFCIEQIRQNLYEQLNKLQAQNPKVRLKNRYEKFRKLGACHE
ncbi:acetyl-CoA carboxylase carboxyltransferase subunit alpha [Anaerorhabdus sp.]|uniref:acetyl-CoA carboxytransferase n=1 Tax=bioreactor metagenome TaxID=1076179 RepID=A0A645DA71_9ZZZZ|nr:acetyl-CoA carboxylase carboxyltransferase subunit alpha [Anaerorhabdus sp.]MEA4875783.1 acetyl-CoA carboxylase carboxyltransferase subunit alpha [Anaerorhabdus sp.]